MYLLLYNMLRSFHLTIITEKTQVQKCKRMLRNRHSSSIAYFPPDDGRMEQFVSSRAYFSVYGLNLPPEGDRMERPNMLYESNCMNERCSSVVFVWN